MRLRPSSPAGGEILGHLHRQSQAAEQPRLPDLLWLASVQNEDGTPHEDTAAWSLLGLQTSCGYDLAERRTCHLT